jgi:hypothetical protein
MILAIAALLLQLQPTPSALSIDEFASAPTPTTEVVAEATANGTANGAGESEASGEPTPIHWNLDSVTFDEPSLTLDKGDKSTVKGPALASLNNVSLAETQKQGISTVRIPDPEPAKPIQITPAETLHPSRAWLALSFVQHSAATFDAYSTRQAIGRGAMESDPIMRPFAHSGALYGAIQVGPVLLDLVARRMQRSENNFFRRMWWMPQSVATAGFLFSGVHNLGVSSNLKH